MKTFSQRIQQAANIKLLLVLSAIMFCLGYAITSSISPSEELMALAHGRNVPDAQFWRPADALYLQLADYGEYGRRLYLARISPVDLFIPLAQALFLSVAISLAFRRAFDTNSRWQRLNSSWQRRIRWRIRACARRSFPRLRRCPASRYGWLSAAPGM